MRFREFTVGMRVVDRGYRNKLGVGRVLEKTKRRLLVQFVVGAEPVWYDAPHAAQFLDVAP